jgi:hypothetical protein
MRLQPGIHKQGLTFRSLRHAAAVAVARRVRREVRRLLPPAALRRRKK